MVSTKKPIGSLFLPLRTVYLLLTVVIMAVVVMAQRNNNHHPETRREDNRQPQWKVCANNSCGVDDDDHDDNEIIDTSDLMTTRTKQPREVFVGIPRISKTYRQCMDDGRGQGTFECVTSDPIAARREMDAAAAARSSSSSSSKNKLSRYSDVMAIDGFYNMGVPQRVDGSGTEKDSIKNVIQEMVTYFYEEVLTKPIYDGVRHKCVNYYELCAFWAAVGECETNRMFMIPSCAAACRFCLLHHSLA